MTASTRPTDTTTRPSCSQPAAPLGNLWQYYAQLASRISSRDNDAAALPDQAAFEAQRANIHQDFMISLGLSKLPERCDLKPTITGSFQGEGYTAQKLAYQLLPDVWGTANIYRPANLAPNDKAPAILYNCGHHISGVIGYQEHAVAWAQRGYICLIFDTIEQHDNPGEHHGLNSGKTPGWISMGYSSAGGEIFNGMRALDLLVAQPDVDPARIGATGISGGGSQSFRLAIADSRIAAVAPVAGISDPAFAIADRHVQNHCGCFYEHNRFGRDITHWASLIAPRPILLCFARHDQLFTPNEYHTIFNHLKKRYEKRGFGDACQLLEYDGQHGYNFKSTCDAIHNFFDEHVAREPHPEVDTLALLKSGKLKDEPTLSICNGVTPEPNHLEHLPALLSHRGQLPLPQSPQEWQSIQSQALAKLQGEVFHMLDDIARPQKLTQYGDWTHEGTDRLAWHGELDGMDQRLMHMRCPNKANQPVVIVVGDRHDDAQQLAVQVRGGEEDGSWKVSALGIEPRAAGRSAPHPTQRDQLNREGCLVGLTPTAMMVQDIYHLLPAVMQLYSVKDRPIYLYGKGEGALAMLYAMLMLQADAARSTASGSSGKLSQSELSRIGGVILQGLPWSHREGQNQILGVDTVCEIGQAVGLLAPLPVALIQGEAWGTWSWTSRVYGRLNESGKLHRPATLAEAINTLIPA